MLDIITAFNQLQHTEKTIRDEHQATISRAKENVTVAEKRLQKAQTHVEKLEQQLNKLPHTGWVDGVVEPLAKVLAERTGLHWDIYGPFGVMCETSIYLMRDKDISITKQKTLAIRLEPHYDAHGDLIVRYRTCETTNEYQKGSIGWMNGMNCVTEPLPDTIKEIQALLIESEASS